MPGWRLSRPTTRNSFAVADYWILDDENQPVPAELMEWVRFFENADRRRVAGDNIAGHWVSTVFLGIDHRFGEKGPPLLFETIVFPNDDWIDECHRYSTWD